MMYLPEKSIKLLEFDKIRQMLCDCARTEGSRAAALALIENLQREDLDPIEEALGYKELAERFDYTQEEISNLVGASRPAIANAFFNNTGL